VLAPGDSSPLRVVLETATFKKGPFKKAILVKTNDPRCPEVVLYIYGTTV
jgi:hypothetical protein